jgi:chromate transporter
MSPQREVAAYFVRLGIVAFGGPAAHIAMMREDLVRRRRWVSDAEFLDLLGITNLIPGPNSTEMAIHLGYTRAGAWGLVLGGVCFIVPAMLIVLALAWAYVRWGALPVATSLLYGVKPVVIAIVVQAMWGLARTAVRGPVAALAFVVAAALALAGVHELLVLFGVGGVAALIAARRRAAATALAAALVGAPTRALAAVAMASGVALGTMTLVFLKIGAVLYGSGYVLLAFLRADFVERLGWLTDRPLLDPE